MCSKYVHPAQSMHSTTQVFEHKWNMNERKNTQSINQSIKQSIKQSIMNVSKKTYTSLNIIVIKGINQLKQTVKNTI